MEESLGAFARTEQLIGREGLEKLRASRVAVFGLGGVGGFAAEALARSGVGSLTLVDFDTVSPSNLNRQIIALHSTLGRPKTELFSARIADISPDCRVEALSLRYLPENADRIDLSGFSHVLDAVDTVAAKLELIGRCTAAGVPVLSCMGTANKLDPSLLRADDIANTSGCPLARVMRRELKKRGIGHCRVIFSPEPPVAPTRPEGERRAVPGSMIFVPASAGLLAAAEIVKALLR